MNSSQLANRIECLEWRIRRLSAALGALLLFACGLLIAGATDGEKPLKETKPGELKVTRLVVVDDDGKTRVVIGQDPKDLQRISRATGITLFDKSGAERGGFSTMEDGSVILGMARPLVSVRPCATASACASNQPGPLP
jgi:hypothetical protein